ncbi:cupin domain-containing protein [Haloferula sargassicola]|uniref:Cupin type-2 domain-containing protein n=1 Tax=Haloferula sargassicola TaxID=490096 RepID=A0ABP9UMP7_9BACT
MKANMRISNIDTIEEKVRVSPRGRYQIFRKSLSLAVGGIKDVGDWGGGHPFDVELARIPPGKANFPLHYHAAQSEFYLVLSGTGVLHEGGASRSIIPGAVIFAAPGDTHQLENNGVEDLVYLVVADNPRSDICTYPDSGKVYLKPLGICLDNKATDYYGEDD